MYVIKSEWQIDIDAQEEILKFISLSSKKYVTYPTIFDVFSRDDADRLIIWSLCENEKTYLEAATDVLNFRQDLAKRRIAMLQSINRGDFCFGSVLDRFPNISRSPGNFDQWMNATAPNDVPFPSPCLVFIEITKPNRNLSDNHLELQSLLSSSLPSLEILCYFENNVKGFLTGEWVQTPAIRRDVEQSLRANNLQLIGMKTLPVMVASKGVFEVPRPPRNLPVSV